MPDAKSGLPFYIRSQEMKTVPRVFAYLRRYPWMAVGTLACAIFTSVTVTCGSLRRCLRS